MVKGRQAFLCVLVFVAFLVLVCVSDVFADSSRDPQFRRRINCEKLKDGNYVFGCSRFYSICTNGIEYPMHCFDGLVINPSNNQCDAPKDVSICQKSGDSNLYPFTCVGRPDGNYETNICSAFYYQCHGGRQFEQPCPPGLAYSPKDNTCDFIEKCKKEAASRLVSANLEIVDPIKGNSDPNAANVNANLNRRSSRGGAARRSSAYTGYASAENPSLVYQQQKASSPALQPIESSVVEDGFIVDEVESSSGQEAPIQPATPPQDPIYVPEKAPPPPPAVPVSYLTQQSTISVAQPAPLSAPALQPNRYSGSGSNQPAQVKGYAQPPAPKVPLFDCLGKEDGVYLKDSTTCTDTFYKCSNGNGFMHLCPATLFYNVDNNQCDYKKNVVACGGQSPTKTNTPGLDLITAIRKPIAFDCSGKIDGYYQPELCSSVFFSCIGGMDSQINCPAGTVFDITSLVCDYPSQCGQPRNSAPATQMQSQAISHGNTDYYMKQQVLQQVQKQQYQAPISLPNTTKALPQQVQVYQALQQAAPMPQPIYQPAQQYLVPKLTNQPQQVAPVHQPPQGQASMSQPTAAITYGASTPVSQSPAFSCAGKQDGYYYKKACTASFLICSAGQVSTETCPGNLVFDPSIAYCQYPDVCGQPITTTAATPIQYPSMVYPPATPTTTPKSVLDFDCSGLPDGYTYKTPCITTFYTCASGHTIELNCPASLVFDPTTVTCQYPDQCGKAKQQQPMQAQPAAQSPTPQTYYTVPAAAYATPLPTTSTNTTTTSPLPAMATTQAYYASPSYVPALYPVQQQSAPLQQQPQTSGLNCSGRLDGYYWKQQCIASYYSCNGGQTHAINCPSGLVFDPMIMQCDYASQCGKSVTANSAPPSTTVTTSASPLQQNPEGYQQQSYQQQQIVQQPSQQQTYGGQQQGQQQVLSQPKNFTCNGRIDGYYIKKSCTTPYFSCVGGVASQLSCPVGLVFDVSTANCEYPEQCGQAASSNQPSTPSPSPALQQPYSQQLPYQAGITANQASPSDSQQQSSNALSINKITYVAQSSGSMKAASQSSPTTTAQPAVPASEFDCSQRETGYYSKGCFSRYYSCHSGTTYAFQCPSNLMYSQTIGACDHPKNVLECGGKPPAQPQQQTAQQQPAHQSSQSSGYSQLQVTSSNMPSPATLSCGNLTTGTHKSAPCSAKYLTCWNGRKGQGTCFNSLVYNPANGQCDYPINVEGCAQFSAAGPVFNQVPYGLSSAANKSPSASVTSASSAYTQQQQGQMEPRAIPPSVCQQNQKSDGYISTGCSPLFFHCTGGITRQLSCASGLFYDVSTGNCEYKDNVPACGGKKTASPTNPPVQQLSSSRISSNGQSSPSLSTLEFDCSKHPSGYFSNGCSNRYYSCHSSTGYLLHCPSGLKYAQQTQTCDLDTNVPECDYVSQSSLPVASQQQQPVKLSASYPAQDPQQAPQPIYEGQQIKEKAFAPPQPQAVQQAKKQRPQRSSGKIGQNTLDFEQAGGDPCATLAPGVYARPCSPHYFKCKNKMIIELVCPESNVFDVQRGSCTPKAHVVSCMSSHLVSNSELRVY